MKKAILTLSIILGIALSASAQWGGGLFGRGAVTEEEYYGASYREGEGSLLSLPTSHGTSDDVSAPLGSGLLILTAMGAGYAAIRRKKSR